MLTFIKYAGGFQVPFFICLKFFSFWGFLSLQPKTSMRPVAIYSKKVEPYQYSGSTLYFRLASPLAFRCSVNEGVGIEQQKIALNRFKIYT